MSCATVEPPTEAVGSADAVEIALRAERAAEVVQDERHQRGVAARHALHEAQLTELWRCGNRARSKALKAAITSAREVKISQHHLADRESAADKRHTELGRAGGDPVALAEAKEAYDQLNHEWMAEWDVLRERADDILEAPIQHPDDLSVRYDAYLCLLGDRVEPLGTCDENTELEALKSIKDGLVQLRSATCRVDAVAKDFMGFVDTQDLAYGVEPETEAKAVAHMHAIEAFAAGSRAESFAGLAFRLSLLGSLADEIEDCASSDCEERQARAAKAIEAVRDIAGNALSLLSLPVDRRAAVYYLGERNLADLSDSACVERRA